MEELSSFDGESVSEEISMSDMSMELSTSDGACKGRRESGSSVCWDGSSRDPRWLFCPMT